MPLASPGMQNRFMTGNQGMSPEPLEPTPQPQQGPTNPMMPQGAPMGAGAPPAQPPRLPSREELTVAKSHLSVMVSDLSKLTEKPLGSLTKKDVFSTASDMLAKGAFSTPEEKQVLIKEMAGLPDDDNGIRKVIGAHLLKAATALASVEHLEGLAQ